MDEERHIFTAVSILFLLLSTSAMVSGYEVAFFSLRKEEFSRIRGRLKKIINLFRNNSPQILATILITNNLVNIAIVINMVYLFESSGLPELPRSILETLFGFTILLVGGEIFPKTYATRNRMFFLRFVSPLLFGMYVLLYPFAWLLASASKLLARTGETGTENIKINDLLKIIEKVPEKVAPKEEKELLRAILKLSRLSVKGIMTPRTKVIALPYEMTTQEVFEFHQKHKFSKYPVYKENLDNIQGVFYAKDLLHLKFSREKKDWKKYIRQAHFVGENVAVSSIVGMIKEKKVNIFIVVDEFGGTAGIVTINDLVYEIFFDKTEPDEHIKMKKGNTCLVNAQMSIVDFLDEIGMEPTYFDDIREETETLAGLFLEKFQRIPRIGDKIKIKNFEFVVNKMENNAISELKVIKTQ